MDLKNVIEKQEAAVISISSNFGKPLVWTKENNDEDNLIPTSTN